MMPAIKGMPEVDEDALRDLADAHLDDRAFQPEEGREDRDEDVGVYGIEEDLKDGVEGDEPRGILPVAACQIVPYDDHGDAPGKADHDEAVHVVGVSSPGR